ncbi:fungal specific transcription factor domain-containing protein [Aspergillus melleus]|uniref:fungal specific transcription factor domain-containing protein n=1 Tax=Aspergillus melleus TaxID=138277 RepID=UPI001E8ED688|nr:uncharacterized protein LDX57_000651 [Aspergillus melleus]KAH8422895.1 hypothetical protein LDX57_000651 [Aspergillus melleus]
MIGLHRDPSLCKSMSPYWAEIRRRLWATTLELDLQAALSLGTPVSISQSEYDCRPPSKFDDEDLQPNASNTTATHCLDKDVAPAQFCRDLYQSGTNCLPPALLKAGDEDAAGSSALRKSLLLYFYLSIPSCSSSALFPQLDRDQ